VWLPVKASAAHCGGTAVAAARRLVSRHGKGNSPVKHRREALAPPPSRRSCRPIIRLRLSPLTVVRPVPRLPNCLIDGEAIVVDESGPTLVRARSSSSTPCALGYEGIVSKRLGSAYPSMMDGAAPGKGEQCYGVHLDAETATLERMASGEIGWPICQCASDRGFVFDQQNPSQASVYFRHT
jgi:hypothetical protein